MYDTLIQERGLINQEQTTTATSWLTESVLCTHGLQDSLAVSPREHLQRSESLLGHIDKLDHLKLRAHTQKIDASPPKNKAIKTHCHLVLFLHSSPSRS